MATCIFQIRILIYNMYDGTREYDVCYRSYSVSTIMIVPNTTFQTFYERREDDKQEAKSFCKCQLSIYYF